ncbi:MAG: 6-bladed beta-propeller [Balneola sp.]
MKLTSFAYLIFVSTLIISCSNTDQNSTVQEIDYATLNTLNFTTELEIGESEDFLPGNLTSLVVTSNGDIIVADRGNVSIEQFDTDGNYRGRVAKEGQGPGEVSGFFSLKNLGNDTLLVTSSSGTIMKFGATSDGMIEFISDEKLDQNGNSFSIFSELKPGQYLASKQLVIRDITRYLQNVDDYRTNTFGIINADGSVMSDSLFGLKTSYPHIEQTSNGGISINAVPYRFIDRISMFDDGSYIIARVDSGFAKIYDNDHSVQKTIPLNIKEREITDADLEYSLRELEGKTKSDIAQRVGSIKPPYQNMWTSSDKIWLLTDTNESGKEIAVLDLDGKALGKFMLSIEDNIQHIDGDYIYSIFSSETEGDLIRKYKVEL